MKRRRNKYKYSRNESGMHRLETVPLKIPGQTGFLPRRNDVGLDNVTEENLSSFYDKDGGNMLTMY